MKWIIKDINAPLIMPTIKPTLRNPEAFNEAIKLVKELAK